MLAIWLLSAPDNGRYGTISHVLSDTQIFFPQKKAAIDFFMKFKCQQLV